MNSWLIFNMPLAVCLLSDAVSSLVSIFGGPVWTQHQNSWTETSVVYRQTLVRFVWGLNVIRPKCSELCASLEWRAFTVGIEVHCWYYCTNTMAVCAPYVFLSPWEPTREARLLRMKQDTVRLEVPSTVSLRSVIFAFELCWSVLNDVAQKTISPFSARKNHVMCDQWTGDSCHVAFRWYFGWSDILPEIKSRKRGTHWPNLFGPEQTNGLVWNCPKIKFYK